MAATTLRYRIEDARSLVVGVGRPVPLLDGRAVPYVNLDNAASTPPLRPVLDKLNQFMEWYSSVHRGAGYKSRVATKAYDEAHEIVADFLGADLRYNTVIFVKNATEAVNKLAHRMARIDGLVIATGMEHHSNDLPWRRTGPMDYVEVDRRGALIPEDLEEKLKRHQGRVKLVAVTGASNVTGFTNPIHELAALAHRYGAKILVDVAQLAPHRRVDMRPDDDPTHLDYLVLSGHKIYAPYGTGALIGPKSTFLSGDPDLVGGGTVDIVTVDSVAWTGLPDKEEAGSPNVAGAVTMAKAMLVLKDIGMDQVAEHEKSLTRYALERMADIPGLRVYGSADPDEVGGRLGVISFNLGDTPHALVAAVLAYEAGVGVRNGCFCAHPYLLKLLAVPEDEAKRRRDEILRHDRTNLPGMVRASFGIYNDRGDVDRLVDALRLISGRSYRGRYRLEPFHGAYYPEGFEWALGEAWGWE
ncbi:MAG TPA: aminotransferase class V-fold PLP-dependent enzyme [Bacillota bacterium]